MFDARVYLYEKYIITYIISLFFKKQIIYSMCLVYFL
jgi:hypothetical protein